MLIELRLRNVAVIDAVTLPLAGGLNVLTGETGAGKSLIVGALAMLLGERAAADRVRTGTDKATVEGVFDIGNHLTLRALLDARGVDADEDDVLVLKREIGSNGRSRAWVNGSPVTAAVLAEIGALLVSVHGQHDSRQLLESEHQRDVLDAFVGAMECRTRVVEAFHARSHLVARERDLLARRDDASRRSEYLRFVVAEIHDAMLKADEEQPLDDDIRRLSNASELRALASQAAAALQDDEQSALARLSAVRRVLQSLTRIDPPTTRWQSTFDETVYALEALAQELDDYAEQIEADPERLRRLEARRETLVTLRRKYGPQLDDVIATGRAARAELDLVDGASDDMRSTVEARMAADRALRETAMQLSGLRERGAHQLAHKVTQLLPELGMPDGRVAVVLTTLDDVTAFGAESVTFLATLNVGSELRPLGRIASGGELARIMLALSTVLAELQQAPTLVFDEVDAGIGGAVAWQVGALMRRVAGHHQVLAISHLAQIAARAHHHVVVRKGAIGAVTTADTEVVVDDARVLEISRMLGGDSDREVSRAHARELLERGGENVAAIAKAVAKKPTLQRATQRRGKPPV